MDNPQTRRQVLNEVSLTEREVEVLQLKARRRTNAEIAKQLFISITTVKWHVRQIYNKLGVNNRAEATVAARQLGLLDPSAARPQHPHRNLPHPATPFIGRTQELRDLTGMLTNNGIQILTLVGPGGIGKTRLALQAATVLHDRFRDQPCWVNFSGQDDSRFVFSTVEEFIITTIISAIGLSLQGSTNPKYLLESYLQNREILFILDSFEHLLSGAAVVSDLLQGRGGCKFLITSRERLGIPGETLFHLQGLKYSPETGEEATMADAVHLFLQTAERVSNKYYQDPLTLATIERICQRLEGLPLAIELAADWSRLLAIPEIEQELKRGLGFLEAGSTSLRTVFDRSWNLLTEHQRQVFARLSVFQRSFTRQAARSIAGADLGTLSALFDKSLVQQAGESRYAMHDLLHHYAAEQLSTSGKSETVRDAHCAYFAALTADQRDSIYRGDHSKILDDLDNIRAAWQWAVRRHHLEDLHKMLWPLDWFYNLQANYTEAMAAMQLAIDALSTPDPIGLQGIVYGRALTSYALEQARVQGPEQAAPGMRQGLEILRHLEAYEDLAWPQLLSGFAIADPQEREQNYLDSLAIFEARDDPYGIAVSLGMILGSHYTSQGRYAEAQQSIEHGLAISRSLADPEGEAAALRTLGHLNLHLGDYEVARSNFQDESKLWRRLTLSRLVGEAIYSVGETYLAEGNFKQAERSFQDSLKEFELVGDERCKLSSMLALAQIAVQQGELQKAHGLLRDARPILDRCNDSLNQASWWQLSGRVSLQQGNQNAARRAFNYALEYSLQGGEISFTETILDFVDFYFQIDDQIAGRLLGYAQSQNGLPAALRQRRIEPLRISIANRMDAKKLALLLKEGARFDQRMVFEILADK